MLLVLAGLICRSVCAYLAGGKFHLRGFKKLNPFFINGFPVQAQKFTC
jgi:hypothetical protein